MKRTITNDGWKVVGPYAQSWTEHGKYGRTVLVTPAGLVLVIAGEDSTMLEMAFNGQLRRRTHTPGYSRRAAIVAAGKFAREIAAK